MNLSNGRSKIKSAGMIKFYEVYPSRMGWGFMSPPKDVLIPDAGQFSNLMVEIVYDELRYEGKIR